MCARVLGSNVGFASHTRGSARRGRALRAVAAGALPNVIAQNLWSKSTAPRRVAGARDDARRARSLQGRARGVGVPDGQYREVSVPVTVVARTR